MAVSKIPSAGIDSGGVAPSNLSTGAPAWDSSGNLSFNSGYGSSAVAYGCRAWCSLNGTGTIAIRGSGNISSVTDLGTGNYQYNFATAMPDANYGTSYSDYSWGVGYTDNFTTTYFRSQTLNSSFSVLDSGFVQVAVFR